MTHHARAADLPVEWRKSSASGGSNDCVEVATAAHRGAVPVRDSKNPDGPALLFTPGAWADFLASVKREELGA